MPELRVPAVVLKQNNLDLYLFSLPSDVLRRICYVLPRSKDNPQQIQRVLNNQRLEDIGKWLKSATATLPNNIIVNLEEGVTFQPGPDPRSGVLVFPTDGTGAPGDITVTGKEKMAYVLDGQHRLAGFDHAGGVVFDLPVTAFLQISRDRAAEVFSLINSTQTKVSSVHLQEIQREIGALSSEKSRASDIVVKLNETKDSPWYELIKTTTQKGRVSSVTITAYIVPIVSDDGPLADKNLNEQTAILSNYFTAFKRMFPEAWGSLKFILTKGIGVYLMTMLFRRIYERCEKYEGGEATPESFMRQMESLRRITWASETYGRFSNAKAMTALWKALLKALPLEDGLEPNYDGLSELGIGLE